MRWLRRLRAVAWKELVQLRRDRLTFGMVLGIPIIQLLLFGYAINNDVRQVPTMFVDQDHSEASRELVRALIATGTYRHTLDAPTVLEVEPALRRGLIKVAIVIPVGLERDLERGLKSTVEVVVDASDPQVTASALTTAAGFFATRQATMLAQRLGQSGGLVPLLAYDAAPLYNPESRSAVNIIPGLTGLILTMTMTMLTAMALARERERGTLEQLIVTPVRRFELVIGKILPYVAIGYLQMTLILLAGKYVFSVPIRGPWLHLYAVAFLFICANLALGMTISTLVKTQQQAMQATFFVFLPNVLLSGFMFPFEGMPEPAQLIGEALPLTHFLRMVRGIVIRGATIADQGSEIIKISIILSVLVIVAAARFSKKLD